MARNDIVDQLRSSPRSRSVDIVNEEDMALLGPLQLLLGTWKNEPSRPWKNA